MRSLFPELVVFAMAVAPGTASAQSNTRQHRIVITPAVLAMMNANRTLKDGASIIQAYAPRYGLIDPTVTYPRRVLDTSAGEQATAAETAATLTNADIIQMTRKKLPQSIIIQTIKTSKHAFDTSAEGVVKLTQAGVSEQVIVAMMEP